MKQDWKRQKNLASNNEVSNELDLGDKNRGKKEKKIHVWFRLFPQ